MTPTICMGNVQRTNAYPGYGVRTLHGLRWRYKAKETISFTPLLAQDTLFFRDVATIYALNIQEGTERWRISPQWEDNDLDDPFRSGALTNDTFYVPWDASPHALCGLSLLDGHVVSRYGSDTIEAALSFPTIVEDLLIGVNAETLCAFDLHHHHLKWSVEGFFSNTPPAFDEHLQRISVSDMFVGNHHHGGLHAFDVQTGEKVWSVEEKSPFGSETVQSPDHFYTPGSVSAISSRIGRLDVFVITPDHLIDHVWQDSSASGITWNEKPLDTNFGDGDFVTALTHGTNSFDVYFDESSAVTGVSNDQGIYHATPNGVNEEPLSFKCASFLRSGFLK